MALWSDTLIHSHDRERAEELIDRAWDATTPAARVKYARKALMVDPDAVDAYVILSLSTEAVGEQIALLREAVRIGKRQWADAIKRPSRHDFWLDIDTRPFMRAAHNLALTLWQRGERDEAIGLADFLLKLNPNDNQGMRYLALAWHPTLGNWQAVERILSRYRGEGRTEYLYAVTLNAVRDGSDPIPLLREAIEANPHVPDFLLGHMPLPPGDFTEYVKFGSKAEAASYARMSLEAWCSVSHGLDWLKKQVS